MIGTNLPSKRHACCEGQPCEYSAGRILELRQRIEADPAFRFALAIEDGKPAIGSGAMTGLVPLEQVLRNAGGAAA